MTLLGSTSMEERERHPSKADGPMEVSEAGRETLSIFAQPSKAKPSRLKTEDGTLTGPLFPSGHTSKAVRSALYNAPSKEA